MSTFETHLSFLSKQYYDEIMEELTTLQQLLRILLEAGFTRENALALLGKFLEEEARNYVEAMETFEDDKLPEDYFSKLIH
ncbi:MAG: hypothetical protein IKS54_05790 [Erysipelotrichaceae bacterium]|nr:hypothetical protein [Erysipelotrichaceae bacterium]